MSENCTITVDNGITTIRFDAAPTYEEVRQVIAEIAADYPYEIRLWDFSNIEFDFSMSDIRAIADYGKLRFEKPSIIAIVAPDDRAYGEMRAFEVYREEEGHATARVFRTIAEATRWIEDRRTRRGQVSADS